MKQAICLLAYKSINYVQAFIDQFENNPDLYFYIHWHGHSKEECIELRNSNANIKYICNQFNTIRFSADLVFAELHLYYVASQNSEIKFCHLMSESDYLICTPSFFVDFFNKAANSNFVTFVTDDFKVNTIRKKIFGNDYMGHKASQWKSLNIETIKCLLSYQNTIEELISIYKAKNYTLIGGAADEFIVPTILINEINIESNNLETNKRYVNWSSCNGHPLTLSFTKYKSKRYNIDDNEVISNLIVRKIDIFDQDCKNFVDYMKEKFNERFINKYD